MNGTIFPRPGGSRLGFVCLSVVWALSTAPATAGEPDIVTEITVAASRAEVWNAWTTEPGVRTFFAPGANIDLRPDGDYEILFSPDSEPGLRGAEGMRLLAVEPERRILFTWNAPPMWPEVRAQRTVVEVILAAAGDRSTRVRLRHFAWGGGEDWAAVRAYFEPAWSKVLRRLGHRFEHGPLDWDHLPEQLR